MQTLYAARIIDLDNGKEYTIAVCHTEEQAQDAIDTQLEKLAQEDTEMNLVFFHILPVQRKD